MKVILLGVGHVFSIKEAIKYIIYIKRPDVVCLELDKVRFDLLEKGLRDSEDAPFIIKRLQKVYDKAAESQGATVGEEMLAGAEAARELGVPHILIDVDISPVVGNILKSLTLTERLKFIGSTIGASLLSKKQIEEGMKIIEEDPETAMKEFEKAFPSLKKDLVDYRDRYMSNKLSELSHIHTKILAVIGEGHIQGISKFLKDLDVEIVHLKEINDIAMKLRSGELSVPTILDKKDNNTLEYSFVTESW